MSLTNRGAGLLLAGTGLAIALAAHHDLSQPRSGLYTIHIGYGAEEDMVACPGTPGRVVTYTSLPGGAADVECRRSDIP